MQHTDVELADIVLDPYVEFFAYRQEPLWQQVLSRNAMQEGAPICPLRTDRGTLYAVVDFGLEMALPPNEWAQFLERNGETAKWQGLRGTAGTSSLPQDEATKYQLWQEARTATDTLDYQQTKDRGWGHCDAFLDAVEERLAISLPRELREFYNSPNERECGDLRVVSPKEFGEVATCAYPPRYLSLAFYGNGDEVGLYFPRLSTRPWIVEWSHETEGLSPVTADLPRFFACPIALSSQPYLFPGPKVLPPKRGVLCRFLDWLRRPWRRTGASDAQEQGTPDAEDLFGWPDDSETAKDSAMRWRKDETSVVPAAMGISEMARKALLSGCLSGDIPKDDLLFPQDEDMVPEQVSPQRESAPGDAPELLVQFGGTPPELELLKPFWFTPEFTRPRFGLLNPVQEADDLLGPLLARFSATDGVPGLVRAHFRTPLDVLASATWLAFSQSLAEAGYWAEAMQALDNGQVVLRQAPFYGDPPTGREWGSEAVRADQAAILQCRQQHLAAWQQPLEAEWLERAGRFV